MAPPQQRGRRPTGRLCLVRVWGRRMARGAAEAQGSHQPFPSWPCSHSTSSPPTILPEEECWRVCGGSQVGTLRLRRSQTHWEQLDRDGHREWGLRVKLLWESQVEGQPRSAAFENPPANSSKATLRYPDSTWVWPGGKSQSSQREVPPTRRVLQLGATPTLGVQKLHLS